MTTFRRSIDRQDFSVKNLPPRINSLLKKAHLPLLNSLEFCTGYEAKSAERVWIWIKGEEIYKVVFYRVIKKLFLNTVEIIGFPEITDEDIRRLIKMHNAHLAVLGRMGHPIKRNQKWHSPQSNVYLKEYITILKLPECKNEYLRLLGRKKRKQLSQNLEKLNAYFNNEIEFRYDFDKEINDEDVLQLQYLNRMRRVQRGKGMDPLSVIQQRQKYLSPLIRSFGLLVTIRHKGEIIGGNLSFIYENKAYMVITGHNSRFDDLRVGNVGIWKTMDYLIDNGIAECNFLWGRSPFKTRFLGVEYPWTLHVISSSPWLATLWKNKLSFDEFYTRCWRFAMTRLGIH
jgi:Acetyltransferase (GNAT) domain